MVLVEIIKPFFLPSKSKERSLLLLRPRRARANSRSRHTLTSTTLPHSRRVLLLSSITRIIINELQSLEKNRKLYLKTANSKQQELSTTVITKECSSFYFIELLSALVSIDGTGDKDAAAQHYNAEKYKL